MKNEKQSLILEIDLLDAVVETMQKVTRTYYNKINYRYLLHLITLLKEETRKADELAINLYEKEDDYEEDPEEI